MAIISGGRGPPINPHGVDAARYHSLMGWLLFLIVGLISGGVSLAIGRTKNFGTWESFLTGALLGVFGVVIIAVMKPQLPAAPSGMRSVKCPRCNMVQNIPWNTEPASYECWQCKASVAVNALLPERRR